MKEVNKQLAHDITVKCAKSIQEFRRKLTVKIPLPPPVLPRREISSIDLILEQLKGETNGNSGNS